jgi:hypothetical protein
VARFLLCSGGLEPAFRVLFSAIFHGVAWEKCQSGRKHWKAVEAKLLQTAASLRTFFVLVMFAETLESLVAFLGILERWMPKYRPKSLVSCGYSRAIAS